MSYIIRCIKHVSYTIIELINSIERHGGMNKLLRLSYSVEKLEAEVAAFEFTVKLVLLVPDPPDLNN